MTEFNHSALYPAGEHRHCSLRAGEMKLSVPAKAAPSERAEPKDIKQSLKFPSRSVREAP